MYTLKPTEFITYKDKLYKIYRKIPLGVIKEKHIHDVREGWHCDMVLKTRNQNREFYYFLIEVEEAVIIDENTPESSPIAIPSDPSQLS